MKTEEQEKTKIDIGCGKHKLKGFIGVDIDPHSEADIIASALNLPFDNETVDEVYSAHLAEHFSPQKEKKFFDEIYRVLKKDGDAFIKIDRDWTKKRLFKKDPTHKHRYSVGEIKPLVNNFHKVEVKNKIYYLHWSKFYKLFNKIFVHLKK